jgi:hypothetical protein
MPGLDTLPTEIHIQIFSNLDQASSTCLGLTSKKFYPLYGHLYGVGNVSLLSRTSFRGIGKQLCLFELLKDWMGNRISSHLLALYERLAKEWNDAEESELMGWMRLFAGRLVMNEPTNDTLLGPLAQAALRMVNNLPRAEVDALLRQ